MITQLYASLATGFFLLLTVRIFAIRRNPLFNFISYGKDDEEIVHRVVRGHGNFIEYAPLFFILLYLVEEAGTHNHILHSLAIMFMIGRLMHGILFSFMLKKSIILRGGGYISYNVGAWVSWSTQFCSIRCYLLLTFTY
ncbi:MAPEG family protein [Paracoccaceae bacterium]|nr:MAPEG family protein [Paracoccaceae bacterium]